VKALGKAFEDPWACIAPSVSPRQSRRAARLTLADIILGLAKAGNFDPQKLADAAVQRCSLA